MQVQFLTAQVVRVPSKIDGLMSDVVKNNEVRSMTTFMTCITTT